MPCVVQCFCCVCLGGRASCTVQSMRRGGGVSAGGAGVVQAALRLSVLFMVTSLWRLCNWCVYRG
jgi:hypothetical protein